MGEETDMLVLLTLAIIEWEENDTDSHQLLGDSEISVQLPIKNRGHAMQCCKLKMTLRHWYIYYDWPS